MSKNKVKNNENDNQESLLEKAIQAVTKEYGNDAIMDMKQKNNWKQDVIKTGSLLLDLTIGIGGYPRGRIIEVYGAESSGKTTLALHAISEVQKQLGKAAFIDVEHALDPIYAQKIGVNLEELIIIQPNSGEQALGILELLVKSNALDLIVIDSVAALTPEAELNGEMSDQTIGAQARLMSKALRKLNGVISKTNCLVFFINQIREKVGIIFGNPEITPGGRALRFYASLRIELRKGEQIVVNQQLKGHRIKVKIVKNKVAPPFGLTILDIYFDRGICRIEELISLGIKSNFFSKNGAWYYHGEQKIALGREKVREFLVINHDFQNQLEDNVKEWLKKFYEQANENDLKI